MAADAQDVLGVPVLGLAGQSITDFGQDDFDIHPFQVGAGVVHRQRRRLYQHEAPEAIGQQA